ncbi:sister chromatid cohesion protein Ctf8, putative [Cordyceps militaris CM01]|uniref:Sister chromatid cohesion protein Ctf8, putative n=2 Tax=Cordyceps militaris TaxID=73501 RepID=G3JI73_CORMM|nr:sister chromatid cohesion protein Ctf8, putative [Cordyceps militaris CM01]ATY58684.1 sister chromatid cohesion [Cordyceps militaris]EGX91026.1 sister chromatid cohesion protein Ctf8, putative [Cordyceps militaris CM01]
MQATRLEPPRADRKLDGPNPLPQLIQTPSGLALLELQGNINLPKGADGQPLSDVHIGRITFPDYDPAAAPTSTAWMKCVYMFVGQHQRLTGEVRKLPRAVAVVRRRENRLEYGSGGAHMEEGENLEVVEIIKYKLIFSNRPEPVGTEKAA